MIESSYIQSGGELHHCMLPIPILSTNSPLGLVREQFRGARMMARAAAGMGVAGVELSTKASAGVPHQFLATVNLGRRSTTRLMCLAPSALYSLSTNSSPYRPAGYLQLGLSVWKRSSSTTRIAAATAPRAESGNELESSIKDTTSKQPVVVYSKSWCPYCNRVKKLLGSLGYDIKVIELDQGGQPGLQDALERVTGQYTVPNVFIGGKHIGGCDDTVALHSRGQLEPLLQAAGANKK